MRIVYFRPVVSSSSSSLPNLSRRRLASYHTSAHNVPLVRIYNAGLKCAARGSLKYRTQKFAIWAPSHKFVWLYLRNQGMYRKSGKIVKHQYLLSYPTICRTSIHQRLRSVGEFGTPQIISTGFASCLRYCSDVANRRPTKLCTMFGRLLRWYDIYIYIFGGSCPLAEFRQVQNSLYKRLRLAFSYISIVTARHSSSGRQPNFAARYKRELGIERVQACTR